MVRDDSNQSGEPKQTIDSQYIQQHLANERTFLAWVRTAVAVVGLGLLAVGVVFRTPEIQLIGHKVAGIVGIGSVLFGIIILSCATLDYLKKRVAINQSTFLAPRLTIWIIYTCLALTEIFIVILVILLFVF